MHWVFGPVAIPRIWPNRVRPVIMLLKSLLWVSSTATMLPTDSFQFVLYSILPCTLFACAPTPLLLLFYTLFPAPPKSAFFLFNYIIFAATLGYYFCPYLKNCYCSFPDALAPMGDNLLVNVTSFCEDDMLYYERFLLIICDYDW